ncbi:MAG: 2-isopropylmalate synthase [Armatimonadota bacterium]|nr:2-isopropylmalate synthase [Armatimonadota bacterium]MDR7450015.1 2-isopropylmalate synthase [Armatimonadota bacterium]MDR7460188.1 2-isopropylmalate synthase [Armatimonadota bacterium]MDR7480729.1 2-isopropylmalate synthase [Armatimonadota bacterium]MDR7488925.1 2-isopropylmalate synthase [Armatimonadota bacterium]
MSATVPTDRVAIFDTTLRDGEQAPGFAMTPEEKVRVARALEALRVDVIEAGFPIASRSDFAAVQAVAHEVREVTVAALARTVPADIEAAAEALRGAARPRLHTFIATSDVHLTYKLGKTRAQVLEEVERAVRQARRLVPEVEFSAEDASRTDPAYLVEVFRTAVAAGARVLNIPDTVGYATPEEFGALVRRVCEAVADMPGAHGEPVTVSVHCHDDLGLAVANSLAGVAAGARQVECTVNGIGERAGNAALEEVVMALRTRRDRYGVTVGVETTRLSATSALVAAVTGVAVPPNKAIVGANAFAHEAGIHQHGVLRHPATYEIMRPADVGAEGRLVLGRHSGRHALQHALEAQGIRLDEAALEAAFQAFKALAEARKYITAEDLRALVPTPAAGAPSGPGKAQWWG